MPVATPIWTALAIQIIIQIAHSSTAAGVSAKLLIYW